MKNLLVFASGTVTSGGSGFEMLCKSVRAGVLRANIVGVVSNHPAGGVFQRAQRFQIPFVHFPSPWTRERYQKIIAPFQVDFVALSGWLKFVRGLDPRVTFNIHPGPLPLFGGPGLYGYHVHQAVLDAYHRDEISESAVTMHFVTEAETKEEGYDKGPVFFTCQIPILSSDTVQSLTARVNQVEHRWQPIITDLVVNGDIYWDGKDPHSLVGARHQ